MGGPRGSLSWDYLGSQGFPSHGWSGTPYHGIPWAPKGSLSHGSPPMGSLWVPKGPLPWGPTPAHPIPIPTPASDCAMGPSFSGPQVLTLIKVPGL